MKHLKRLLSATLAIVLCAMLQLPTFAAPANITFSDVSADAWYAPSVTYVSEKGFMGGTSPNRFSPDAPTSRAMLVTILHRIAGTPMPTNQARFQDVSEGQWYTQAVSWAVAANVVSGYDDDTFGTNDAITREQLATILWRYADSPTPESTTLTFADAGEVSGFATQAVSWAQERGIISGKAGNRFDPKGNTTRAEVAVMLHRFLTADETEVPPSDTENSRVLVAYFSRSGTTQAVAEQIEQELGADVFRITATHSYPTDYRETTAQAQEELDRDFRPVLTDTVENMAQYDTVILGYPIWWGTTPMAVRTFLESYDLSGKTIVPFSTHEGSGLGSSLSDIRRLTEGAEVTEGLAIRNGSQDSAGDTIRQWLDRVGVESRTAEAPQATQITMTVGTTVITAELSDSPTTRDFLATLPNTVTLSRYGDREYYGNPGAALSTDGTPIPDYENGDVTFYPPSGNLAIFFGQQDSSNQPGLIRMGKMTSDLSVFDAFGQSIEMTIEIVSQ